MDVIVAGGGPAGMAAAVAAARRGANVFLLEGMGFLGGDSGPIGHNFFNGFYNAKTGEQTIKGIPQELIDRLVEAGACLGHVILDSGASIEPFDGEAFRFVADDFVLDAGVKVLLHSSVVSATVEDGRIRKIVVANCEGLTEYSADVYIDATGDGDLSAYAGAPFNKSEVEDIQRSTLMFKFSHVNIDRIMNYAARNPGEVALLPSNLGVFGFEKFITEFNEEAQSEGETAPFPRNNVVALSGLGPGEYWMLMVDVGGDASTAAGMTELEVTARKQAWRMLPYLRRIPGFEGAHMTQVANRIGVRETRHVIGEYMITEDDLANGREFDDVVCHIGAPGSMHDTPRRQRFYDRPIEAERGMYDVPYRALLPLKVDNLLVAGRCVSADPVVAGSLRLGACCLATGQVVGLAAALAVQQRVAPRALDVKLLQTELKKVGAL